MHLYDDKDIDCKAQGKIEICEAGYVVPHSLNQVNPEGSLSNTILT